MKPCVCWPEREHPGHGFRVETPFKIVPLNEICWNAGGAQLLHILTSAQKPGY